MTFTLFFCSPLNLLSTLLCLSYWGFILLYKQTFWNCSQSTNFTEFYEQEAKVRMLIISQSIESDKELLTYLENNPIIEMQ